MFQQGVIIFTPLSILSSALSLFTSFSTLLYLFSCCPGHMLTSCSGDNDQTPQLPHPHMHVPTHTHTHQRLKPNQTPKTNLFLCVPGDMLLPRLWGASWKHTLLTHTHTLIHRVCCVPHAVTGRKAFSTYGPLGELEDLTASCTNTDCACVCVRGHLYNYLTMDFGVVKHSPTVNQQANRGHFRGPLLVTL